MQGDNACGAHAQCHHLACASITVCLHIDTTFISIGIPVRGNRIPVCRCIDGHAHRHRARCAWTSRSGSMHTACRLLMQAADLACTFLRVACALRPRGAGTRRSRRMWRARKALCACSINRGHGCVGSTSVPSALAVTGCGRVERSESIPRNLGGLNRLGYPPKG